MTDERQAQTTPIRDCQLNAEISLLCKANTVDDLVAKCYGIDDDDMDSYATGNAERLAACWNAMRGIEDPAKFVSSHAELVAAAEAALECIYCPDWCDRNLLQITKCTCGRQSVRLQLESALDKVKGKT